MAYSNVPIGTANPGCFVILVDQSWSMSEDWGDGLTKAEGATRAVNRVLEELVRACQVGDHFRDRCHVSVIGYGEQVECTLDGMISEYAYAPAEKVKQLIPDGAGGVVEVEVEMPVRVQPKAENGTPMHEAFDSAAEIVQRWCTKWTDGFPPSVINITDGIANQPELASHAARRVMTLGTTDGKALVYNLHIGSSGDEVILPNNASKFTGDRPAEFLFSISSTLPDALREEAVAQGIPAESDARCFAFNARQVWMIKLLNFGSLKVLGSGQDQTSLPD